ncbi:hypothetical protein BJ944DRAFT_242317 [Cunninghamella echinulata]|nr:hypothetical protein BJ944DRAFT_242317 [Cunninghamella echinulata]
MPSSTTPALFTPIKVGKHILKHRIALAPLTRLRADANLVPTESVVDYYQQRATEGGLLITEATAISETAGGYKFSPGIYSEDQIKSWKKVTDAAHAKGSVIFLQMWHLGRATNSSFLPEGHKQPVSASPIRIQGLSNRGVEHEVPRALTIDEIKSITQDFAKAAQNAIIAGFDGIEIHSANGYLLDQFINTSSNKRTDIYGGSIENRARFSLEVIEAVAKAIGPERTAVRFSPWSGFQDMQDDTPVQTWSYIVDYLQKHVPDLAYIHFTEPRVDHRIDAPVESNSNDSLDPFREIWKGTFIRAGNYTYDYNLAYEAAEKSPNTLIAFGRSFIANPDLVERIKNHWPVNKYDRSTFYTPGTKGYTDYPYYNESSTPKL